MADRERELPHIAILSSPGMGFLIPLAQLAKRLVLHHFSVTFITHTIDSLQITQNTILNTLPKSIKTISLPPISPQEIPPDAKLATLVSITQKLSTPSLLHVLKTLKLTSTHRLVALVVDLFGTDAFDVAGEVGVPSYILYTGNFLALSVDLHLSTLDPESSEPVKMPGCRPIPREDLVTTAQDRTNQAYTWLLHHAGRYKLAKGILVNSFAELEPETLMCLKGEPSHLPVYPVGPLVQSGSTGKGAEPTPNWLSWLDDQPRGSVLFVSFGSGGALSFEQTQEVALGLELSGLRFLWVVRSPNDKEACATYFGVKTDQQEPLNFLPDGFLERTKGVGHVVPLWVPQIEVLSHGSTGGFLSHCGWNSTLESMVHGVPMIAWPMYAEQRTNALILVEDLKVAVRPTAGESGVVKREEIARVVKALMDGGDEGKRIRTRMIRLKEACIKALAPQQFYQQNPEEKMVMEMVLRIDKHCDECIRKVKRHLKGIQYLHNVLVESKSFKVLLKGKGEELLKALERIRWNSHEEVELLYQSSAE